MAAFTEKGMYFIIFLEDFGSSIKGDVSYLMEFYSD